MVIAILAAGVAVGLVVDRATEPWLENLSAEAEPDDPQSEPDAPHAGRLDDLASARQWRALWWAIPPSMLEAYREFPGATALAAMTGVCWLAFALQAIQPPSTRDARAWAPIVAVLLGIASIWPTMFLIYWQEQVWGLHEAEDPADSVRFFVLGVGLREELSKLLAFLPLLPLFVRRRDELGALLTAGCVGIGFGLEENVSYIIGSVASDAVGRMLISVPLHMAMTGLIGLAAYRACVWPKEWAPQLLAVFGVIVLAHGIYDVLVATIVAADYGPLGMLIFVGLVYQFFRELRPLQKLLVEPVSQTANFLFCLSMVVAATFVYLCAAAGWRGAADTLAASVAGEAVMVYLFLRQMPEALVKT